MFKFPSGRESPAQTRAPLSLTAPFRRLHLLLRLQRQPRQQRQLQLRQQQLDTYGYSHRYSNTYSYSDSNTNTYTDSSGCLPTDAGFLEKSSQCLASE